MSHQAQVASGLNFHSSDRLCCLCSCCVDVFVDWKQNANEVIARLRCGDGVQRVEDVATTFTDTDCQARFPDGRQWDCHLHEEIEGSCSKVQYKEKSGFLLLHVIFSWNTINYHHVTIQNKKEKQPVKVEAKNGKDQKQPPLVKPVVKPEKSVPETADKAELSTQTSAPPAQSEQRRGKAERGVKRTMNYKPADRPESGVKAGGEGQTKPVSVSKGDLPQEPSAKRTVRPPKVSKDPTSEMPRDTHSKSTANGKPHSPTPTGRDPQTSTAGDNRSELLGNGHEGTTPEVAVSHTQQDAGISPKAGASTNTNRTERPGEAERTDSETLVRQPPNEADQATETLTPTKQSGSGKPVTATATKQAEYPSSNSTHEEKRDRSKEEPLEMKQEEAVPEPMVNLKLLKNDSYEKGTDLMVVNVYIKGIFRETARVIFREQDFTLIFQTSDANFLRLHADCGANTVFKWQVKLRNLIQPEQSTYAFTPSRLDITLKKRHSQRWGGLEAPATQVGGAKVAVPSAPSSQASQPGSSKHSLPAKEEPPWVGEVQPKPPRTVDGCLDSVSSRTVSDHVPIKQEPAVTPKPTCMVLPMSHAPPAGSQRSVEEEEEEEEKVCLPGFTGLVNLGNTCFMNSVLQSLSNTRELRDYFHDRAFENEINCNNPLGTGGRLAIGFAVLLRALWKGTHHAFQPSKLKAIVASKASQFTGYAQHDAQEFMAFLLDGLHEDLNRIQNKPYTETVDSDGRLDEVVADEAWQRHKMRNDSFIVDLFQGQYKSKLVCPVCSKVSITFDPFLYLPVPLPQKQKVLTVFYFAKEPHKKPMKFLVSVSKENSSTAEVLESISRSVRIKAENLRLAEVFLIQPNFFFPSYFRVCQKKHWSSHKVLCRPNIENVGLPFLVSVPESRLTYARLSQLLEGYSRYSVNVFQPPFQSGRTSPEVTQCLADLPPPAETPEGVGPGDEARGGGCGAGDSEQEGSYLVPESPLETGQASAHPAGDPDALSIHTTDSGFIEPSSGSQDSQGEKETSCEKAVRPEAAVTGYQQPSESASSHTSQFYITIVHSNSKEQTLEEKGQGLISTCPSPLDSSLELVWKNNERLKEYVLVRSKELEFEEDPGSVNETARAGHFTLEQCLNLFTRPEVLAPEEAWYCPKCQQHREASKQLLLWRLPNVLIIQLKRFSFRSFIWRDKINDMVDFPVRNLDLSKFCIGQKDDMQQPPIYDLYAVINHYGGMIGGHYTAYARLPSAQNSQRSDVGWRLFDDSTVTMVEESQVVTRYAYVLFYRRRNSPVERPSRLLGAESPTAAGATTSQASGQAHFGTDLDPEGPPPLTPEVTSELFGHSGECAALSYSNMEEVD
uniref:ubiquitinyl hydrolase 1 n=1 Tax=Hucho hucho TaxID=62062 RepID=A0A4W5MZ38_9TELE